jgi:rhodanese-related sulfurtransferase
MDEKVMILKIVFVLLLSCISVAAQNKAANEIDSFTTYLKTFDYAERKEMKINIKSLLELIQEDKVEVIDIRFPEEVEVWSIHFIKSIPLNELPDRLDELDKSKIIVTVCPHYDRAAIARHYLALKGYKSKYLVEGLLGLTEYLRGDKAKDFINMMKK